MYMILEKAIKTIILTYCIDVIFEKITKNFNNLNIKPVNIRNFIFIHYSRYRIFLIDNNFDFAFHTFMKYLKINNIEVNLEECMEIYMEFWTIKEEDLFMESTNENHTSEWDFLDDNI